MAPESTKRTPGDSSFVQLMTEPMRASVGGGVPNHSFRPATCCVFASRQAEGTRRTGTSHRPCRTQRRHDGLEIVVAVRNECRQREPLRERRGPRLEGRPSGLAGERLEARRAPGRGGETFHDQQLAWLGGPSFEQTHVRSTQQLIEEIDAELNPRALSRWIRLRVRACFSLRSAEQLALPPDARLRVGPSWIAPALGPIERDGLDAIHNAKLENGTRQCGRSQLELWPRNRS